MNSFNTDEDTKKILQNTLTTESRYTLSTRAGINPHIHTHIYLTLIIINKPKLKSKLKNFLNKKDFAIYL